MNSLLLLIIAIVAFFIAYVTYGRWLAKKWGIDIEKPTPANTLKDGIEALLVENVPEVISVVNVIEGAE